MNPPYDTAVDAPSPGLDARPEGDPLGAHRLQELSTRLTHEGDVQVLYPRILDTALLLMRANVATLQMVHPERGELQAIAFQGEGTSSGPLPEWVRLQSEGPTARAARTGTRVVLFDLCSLQLLASPDGTMEIDALREAGIRAMQATPVTSRSGQPLGVIATHWHEPTLPHDRDLHLLDVLARQTADLIEGAQNEARLRKTAQQKGALYALADRLQRTKSLDDVYDAALGAIVAALQCDRASILLFDEAGAMRFVASGGLSSCYQEAVEGHSAWKASDPNPAPIHVDDVNVADMSPALRASVRAEGIGALAFIPLVSDGQLIGKFMAYFDAPHAFSPDEMNLCITIARQVAFAIERKRAEDQLRASERRFRDMIDALPAAVYMTDADGYVVHFNRAAVDLAGRTPVLGVDRWCICSRIYDGDGAFISPDDSPMAKAVRGEAVVRGVELIAERPDGSRRWVAPYPTLLRDASGRTIGGVNMFVDMTERRRAEEALRDADRRKDEFIAMLSHELRNPLAPIAMAVEVLTLTPSADPIQQQAHAIIARQTSNLTRLVDDLLEVSRITSGTIQLQTQRIALHDVVRCAVESARSVISTRRHALDVRLPDQTIWIHADAARLEQVLINLLNNAAKYTDEGGRVQLLVELDGAEVVIRITDNGIGIEPGLLPHIFDLFTQARRSLDRSQGGLGIGLSLVERLVAMHGGTVSAKSVLGQGSEFIVRLPVRHGEAAQATEQVAPVREAPQQSLRVLVVDDNVDAGESFRLLLERLSCEVTLARDGQAALASACKSLPDVVFLDIGLPSIDGYEVARRLRAAHPGKRLILVALTGYGQQSDRERALQAGFDLHLTKPADASQVARYLQEISRLPAR